MKWIGENIRDYVSRFRDTVYFEKDVMITNPSSSGSGALTIDNDDVDQKALYINAANTTGNVLDINAQALTEGKALYIDCNNLAANVQAQASALYIDVDESSTSIVQNTLAYIDYDRTGDLGTGVPNYTTGLNISMNDLATGNHALSTSRLTALDINLDHANANALVAQQIGIDLTLTDADTGYVGTTVATVGIDSTVENGGFDIIMRSSADTGDHCTIATGAAGATTITTVDDDSDNAHLSFVVDGDFSIASTGIDIATDGTISNATWTGTAVASAYLDADTAHLSGSQTFTGTKTLNSFKGTGSTTVTNINDTDTFSDASATTLATSESIKAYADRPTKQLKIYHANFKGNARQSETFIPLAGVPDEHTDGSKEQTAIIMPCAGVVKEIILRMHWTSSITEEIINWKIYNRAKNLKMNDETIIGASFEMDNPTQGANNADNTRTSGEIDYAFAEYDAIAISMQWEDTGPENTADRMYVTVVTELDVSGIGY